MVRVIIIVAFFAGFSGNDTTKVITGRVERTGDNIGQMAFVVVGNDTLTTDANGRFKLKLNTGINDVQVIPIDSSDNRIGFTRTVPIPVDAADSVLVVRVVQFPPIPGITPSKSLEFVKRVILKGPINPKNELPILRKWAWSINPPKIVLLKRNGDSTATFSDELISQISNALDSMNQVSSFFWSSSISHEIVENHSDIVWQGDYLGGMPYLVNSILVVPRKGRPSQGAAWDRDQDGEIESGFVFLEDKDLSSGIFIHELMHSFGIGHATKEFLNETIMIGKPEFTDVDSWILGIMIDKTFEVGESAVNIFGL